MRNVNEGYGVRGSRAHGAVPSAQLKAAEQQKGERTHQAAPEPLAPDRTLQQRKTW